VSRVSADRLGHQLDQKRAVGKSREGVLEDATAYPAFDAIAFREVFTGRDGTKYRPRFIADDIRAQLDGEGVARASRIP